MSGRPSSWNGLHLGVGVWRSVGEEGRAFWANFVIQDITYVLRLRALVYVVTMVANFRFWQPFDSIKPI